MMAYFPMFMRMDAAKVLLVGAGDIARHKLEKLLDFTQDITVLAQSVDEETEILIEKHTLPLLKKAYETGDISGFDIVIVATQTVELHKAIYEESRDLRVLVNSVDNLEYCDFIFPSYVQKGDLTVAFSTAGASPAFSKHIRSHFEKVLPNSIGGFLEKMKDLRTSMPKGKERMLHFTALTKEYFDKNFK
jgi:precorrin-2 dehydrogenase/sirohydrochlorin ferrochelatase